MVFKPKTQGKKIGYIAGVSCSLFHTEVVHRNIAKSDRKFMQLLQLRLFTKMNFI